MLVRIEVLNVPENFEVKGEILARIHDVLLEGLEEKTVELVCPHCDETFDERFDPRDFYVNADPVDYQIKIELVEEPK